VPTPRRPFLIATLVTGIALAAAWSCGDSSPGASGSADAGDAESESDGIGGEQGDAGMPSHESAPGQDSGPRESGGTETGATDASARSDATSEITLGSANVDGGAVDPAVVIDGTNGELLVAATSTATHEPVLYRCDLAGAACTVSDISAGQSGASDVENAIIDPAASKLLVLAADGSYTPALYRCNLDGTGCAHTTLSTQHVIDGMFPALDAANAKLLVGTTDDTSTSPALIRCGLDGTGCTFTDLTATGLPAASFAVASTLIDPAGELLVAVVAQTASGAGPGLLRCATDGTACTYTDLTAGHLYTTNDFVLPPAPSAVLDTSNGKLLVVGCYASMPGLLRCGTDGTGCAFVDLSQGHAAFSVQALIDTAGAKLVVVALDSPSYEPSVRECSLDGSGCVYTSLGASPSATEINVPSAALDPGSARVIVVGSDVASTVLDDFAAAL
jgi:hypothetical protein